MLLRGWKQLYLMVVKFALSFNYRWCFFILSFWFFLTFTLSLLLCINCYHFLLFLFTFLWYFPWQLCNILDFVVFLLHQHVIALNVLYYWICHMMVWLLVAYSRVACNCKHGLGFSNLQFKDYMVQGEYLFFFLLI